jgi:hypothetical protein
MQLTDEQSQQFEELRQKRLRQIETLQDEDFEGAFKLIDDNYAEKAHFIYELLQNADDVKATEVTFILTTDGLLYKHNGENRFSIIDIKSITAYGNSSKRQQKVK